LVGLLLLGLPSFGKGQVVSSWEEKPTPATRLFTCQLLKEALRLGALHFFNPAILYLLLVGPFSEELLLIALSVSPYRLVGQWLVALPSLPIKPSTSTRAQGASLPLALAQFRLPVPELPVEVR
jgi:hypothetical protein